MKNTLVLLTAVVFLLPSCKRTSKDGGTVERESEPPIIEVADDDPAMKKAINDARATVDTFVKHLQNPTRAQTNFSVKAKFSEGDDTEHMWLSDVTFQNGAFHGKLGNEPNTLSKPQLGERVKVAKGDISDWMIIEDGELRGGYSIRLLRSRMSAADQKRLDDSSGMIVNDKILPD